jgi:hypothetical protein
MESREFDFSLGKRVSGSPASIRSSVHALRARLPRRESRAICWLPSLARTRGSSFSFVRDSSGPLDSLIPMIFELAQKSFPTHYLLPYENDSLS